MAAQGQALALNSDVSQDPPQVVAFVCGGWGGDACRALGAGAAGLPQVRQLQRLLEGPMRRCSRRRLTAVSAKETGETAHMERWYKTLCQCIARFVRETLSFSKKNWWHETGWTHWFIVECNLSCSEYTHRGMNIIS